MSIKRRYVDMIMDGAKRVEFRKTLLPSGVDTVVLYVTSPTKRVVGQFSVAKQRIDSPPDLWDAYEMIAGVTENEFYDYFDGYWEGVAIEIDDVIAYSSSYSLQDVGWRDRQPPRSFARFTASIGEDEIW
jgi:predicted transcriptional regulator